MYGVVGLKTDGRELKVSTGIKELDEVFGGGLYPGYVVLVAGHPGAGKTTLASSFLYYGATKQGEAGVYVSLAERKGEFYRHMSSLGLDFPALEREGLFRFIETPTLSSKEIIDSLVSTIADSINEINAKRLVIDPITALMGILKKNEARAFLHATLSTLVKPSKITTYLIADLPLGTEVIGYGFEEFLADVVIKLIVERVKGLARRKLIVHKSREMELTFYEYEFDIRKGGIRLYVKHPRILRGSFRLRRISTGIEELDKMLNGGLLESSTVLISGPSGTGKTVLMLSIALHQALRGNKVLYVSLEESSDQVRTEALALGYNNIKELEGRTLKITSLGPGSMTPAAIYDLCEALISNFKPAIVLIDGLSALERFYGKDELEILARNLSLLSKERGVTLLFSTYYDIIEKPDSSRLNTIADTIIALRFEEVSGELRRVITVLKMRASPHAKEKKILNIKEGRIYIEEWAGQK